MKIGNDLADSNTFYTFNKHTFKKGGYVKYNNRDCVVTGVHDYKTGKLLIEIKDADEV